MTELGYFNIQGASGINEVNGVFEITFSNLPTRPVTISELTAAKRLSLVSDINDLTATKIALIFGTTANSNALLVKQLNASARVSDLQEIVINGGTLTPDEIAEKAAIQGYWNRVKALRVYGNSLEILAASSDPDTFDINLGWPE